MIVNALLLVQMVHFLVAYLILKYIVLKPAFVLMKKLDREEFLLEGNLAVLAEEIARKGAMNEVQWNRHCSVLYARYDMSARRDFLDKSSSLVSRRGKDSLENIDVEGIKDSLAQVLVQKVISSGKVHGDR